MKRGIEISINLLERLLVIMLIALVSLTLWQIFSRYILNSPDPNSEEIIRIILMWFGMLAGAYCVHSKAHVGFSLLHDRLGAVSQKRMEIILRIILFSFAALILIYGGYRLVELAFALNQRTPVLGLPMGMVYMAVPLSGVLICIFLSDREVLFPNSEQMAHSGQISGLKQGDQIEKNGDSA